MRATGVVCLNLGLYDQLYYSAGVKSSQSQALSLGIDLPIAILHRFELQIYIYKPRGSMFEGATCIKIYDPLTNFSSEITLPVGLTTFQFSFDLTSLS
jgi:hypothetical protein